MWRTLDVSSFSQPWVLGTGGRSSSCSRKRVLVVFDMENTCVRDSQSEASMPCTLQDTGEGSCRGFLCTDSWAVFHCRRLSPALQPQHPSYGTI